MDDQQPAEAFADKIAARLAEWMEGAGDGDPPAADIAAQLQRQALERLGEIAELVTELKVQLESQTQEPNEPATTDDPQALARRWFETEGHLDKAIAELEAARKSVTQHTHGSENTGGSTS